MSALTVDVEPGAVCCAARPVGGCAGVEAAVPDLGPAEVHVADHLAVQRHVLPHHVPAEGHNQPTAAPISTKIVFPTSVSTLKYSAEISSPNNAARGDKENYTIYKKVLKIIVQRFAKKMEIYFSAAKSMNVRAAAGHLELTA